MGHTPSREQMNAFRLRGHGLVGSPEERPDAQAALLDAAGRCGVQNSPPGSGILALHARTTFLTREDFTRAVAVDRTLLQSWSLRGAPYLFPTADAVLFTAGALPPTEQAAARLLPGVMPALAELGLGIFAAADLSQAELDAVLRGRALDIHELGRALAARMEPSLSAPQLDRWRAEGPYAAGQPLGEAVVHFLVRLLTLRGQLCLAPREAHRARFVLVVEHLGGSLPGSRQRPEASRAELLRRYLRCYGPASRGDAAAWLGVGARDAIAWWDLLAGELTPVSTHLGRRWLLAEDLPALAAAELPAGTRLLPPGDPYVRHPDRDAIVPRDWQPAVWRTTGIPGTVLLDGEIVATWRPRKRGNTLTVTVTPFRGLTESERAGIEAAAERIGPLRGADTVETRVENDGVGG